MKTSEVLERAADIVEQGWAQKTYGEDDGHFCALGGIRAAVGFYKQYEDGRWYLNLQCKGYQIPIASSQQYLVRVIDDQRDEESLGDSIARWNDDKDRQQHEVVDALRHAAKFAKEDEDAALVAQPLA